LGFFFSIKKFIIEWTSKQAKSISFDEFENFEKYALLYKSVGILFKSKNLKNELTKIKLLIK